MRATEQDAWLALADVIDLPAGIIQAHAEAERLEQVPDPNIPHIRTVERLLHAGHTLEEATAAHQADQAAAHRARTATAGIGKAAEQARAHVRAAIASRRTDLIFAIRPEVERILTDAAPLPDLLARFGQRPDPARIARDANPDELDAWRTSRNLQAALGLLRRAWGASWAAATARQGQYAGGERAPAELRPDAPGGLHAWAEPLAIRDQEVRDGRATDVLDVARWHLAGGYRLATFGEVIAATRSDVTQPYGPSGRLRRVLVPVNARDPQPEYARAGRGDWE
jgi:hypothetical protein